MDNTTKKKSKKNNKKFYAGKNLRIIRELRGHIQERMASIISVKQTHYSLMEKAQRSMSFEQVILLAEFLCVPNELILSSDEFVLVKSGDVLIGKEQFYELRTAHKGHIDSLKEENLYLKEKVDKLMEAVVKDRGGG